MVPPTSAEGCACEDATGGASLGGGVAVTAANVPLFLGAEEAPVATATRCPTPPEEVVVL